MADLVPTVRAPFAISIAEQGTIQLPASYSSAGIVVSLLPTFASVKALWLSTDTAGPTFNVIDFVIKLDTPTPGKVTIHLLKEGATSGGPLVEESNVNLSATLLHYTAIGVAA